MKRTIILTAILCFALLLSACGNDSTPTPEIETPPSPVVTDLPLPTPEAPSAGENTPPTEPSPDASSEPSVEPSTEPSAPPAQSKFPYTIRIENPAQGIYKEPSYDSAKVGMVIIPTVYTIVDEASDDEGFLWGKLKSGAGWVDLDSIRAFEGNVPLVTANFADMSQIKKGGYKEFYPAQRYDWATLADIRVTGPATEVQLVMLEPLDYTVSEVYHTIPSLEPFEPFVTELYFSGDFTTYGISLLDEGASRRMFAISQSGRNGELVVWEITDNY